jgi:RHS repeat-associated protein
VTQYTYDALGNLTAVALPGGRRIEYVVDGRNRRIGKKVNGTLAQGLLYAGQLTPVAELDGAGQVVSRFVYATRRNVPDYMVKGAVTYRLLTDHLGSVRLVVNASTGAVAQRIDYDAFGRVTQNTSPGFQPFGFAGGLYDDDTQLVRLGARDYDAVTGRWTAKDPIGFAGGDGNLYAYAGNNPVSYTDPEGTWIVGAVGAVVGGIAGGIGSVVAQMASNGGNWSCVSWGNVGWAAFTGALGGFAMTTPFGTSLLGAMGIGAATNVLNYGLSTPSSSWSISGGVASGAAGAIGGAIGGATKNPYMFREISPWLNDIGLAAQIAGISSFTSNTAGAAFGAFDFTFGQDPCECGQ